MVEPTTFLLDLLKTNVFPDNQIIWGKSPNVDNPDNVYINAIELNTYVRESRRGMAYAHRSILQLHMFERNMDNTPTILPDMIRFIEEWFDKSGIGHDSTQWIVTNVPEQFHTVTTVFLDYVVQ